MKKTCLIALMCLLPLIATPAFACDEEDGVACNDSEVSEAGDEASVARDKLEEKMCKLGDERPGCSSGLFLKSDEELTKALKEPRAETLFRQRSPEKP